MTFRCAMITGLQMHDAYVGLGNILPVQVRQLHNMRPQAQACSYVDKKMSSRCTSGPVSRLVQSLMRRANLLSWLTSADTYSSP